MGYDTQVDKQFKASMENIEGVKWGKGRTSRFYKGVKYAWSDDPFAMVSDSKANNEEVQF